MASIVGLAKRMSSRRMLGQYGPSVFQFTLPINRLATVYSVARIILLMSAVLLTACESKWEKMPDDILAAKDSECRNNNDQAAAMIQVCKNYKRECERRRSIGVYVC
ncbi:MAG: hypothetical protein V3T17_14150 [Pseudomonadales bacterium]